MQSTNAAATLSVAMKKTSAGRVDFGQQSVMQNMARNQSAAAISPQE
jgi:hypothetical protein